MRLPVRWAVAALVAIGLIGAPLAVVAQTRPFAAVMIPADGYELAGYLSEGEDPSGTWVIFVHGNRAEGQAHVLYRRIAGNLPGDISVLSIDMRGFGNSPSEGLESSDRVLDRTGDIEAAVDYLGVEYGVQDTQIVLIGHSLGALQVLKAGQSRGFRGVISIGPGDFRSFLRDAESIARYAWKLGRAMGVPVSPDQIASEGQDLTAAALFDPCPESPTILMFGALEWRDSLRNAADQIPQACAPALQWVTIPFSDHMYGTELWALPEPLQSAVTWPMVFLLGIEVDFQLHELREGDG